MIYCTGDIHGNPVRFSTDNFPEQKDMTKSDYVIILGDFGLIWEKEESKNEKYWLDWLNDKSFTTLFVDGNHENHERLNSYPVSKWNGGNVHFIRPSVIHLMRGEVFEIEGDKFFTFGGAASHDINDGILEPEDPRIKLWSNDYNKMFRINHVSWWKEELPSIEEMDNGFANLRKHNNEVDFILTHCASSSTAALLGHGLYNPDKLTNYLERIRRLTKFKKWLFGHYHDNRNINMEEILLYEQIIRIK